MRHSITTQNIRLDVGVVSCYSSTCRNHPKRHKCGTKMEKEIWKDIPGYEGYYQVSNLGRVRSLDRVVKHGRLGEFKLKGGIKKFGTSFGGYKVCRLSKDGAQKAIKVHQLVAIAFLNHKPCGRKIVVDHIDNDNQNNRLDNLQLITSRQNSSKDKSGVSQYTGVCWHGQSKKWASRIWDNSVKKLIHLGLFNSEYEAHLAYQEKLKEIEYVK